MRLSQGDTAAQRAEYKQITNKPDDRTTLPAVGLTPVFALGSHLVEIA